jgi:8-oxo-dGTP pyrophosphatase MutT (NUDIX family)
METRKDFSCGGVVIDPKNGRALVVQVENLAGAHVWTFPKGHPEGRESDAEAALREVEEETGWKCRVARELNDVSYFFVREGIRYHKTVRWFLMEPVKETGKPMEGEILACQWAAPESLRSLLTYPTDMKLLDTLGL